MRSQKENSSLKVAPRVASCNLPPDLDLEKFDPVLHIMIEFLKGHPIHKPLTKSTEFPLSIIHTAYSTAVYNSEEDCIEFNINEDNITKLSKYVFLKAIGFPENKEKTTFYEPTNEEILSVLRQLVYLPSRMGLPSNFRKGELPAMWRFLMHFLLRCLTGKTGGTDTVNRSFLVLLFGIYTGKEVDIGTFLWKDFVSHVFPKKKEIPCARFWALALQMMYENAKVEVKLPQGEKMFTPRPISRYTISDQFDFRKVGHLPEAMLQYIDENSEVLIKHKKETGSPEELKNPTQSPQPISPTHKKQIASKVIKTTGIGTKRKCETIPTLQAKRLPTQSIPTSQNKDAGFEKIPDASGGEANVGTLESELDREMRLWHEEDLRAEKERNDQIDLNIDLREEQKKRDEEEITESDDVTIEAVYFFTTDEEPIQDSESSSFMESVKPSKSKVFLGNSDTESEHIEEFPNGETNTLPTTHRRRTKWKKTSRYISRVEFNSLNKKLSRVLDVVKKIPPSDEKFVSKKDFREMKNIITSLAQSVPNLDTTEAIVNSTADILREMDHKRTDDTFEYLNRMDDMVKMVKQIQQSYNDLTKTVNRQHANEIARLNEQLRDYRNKNIILQAVLVKVTESAHQLLKPHNAKLDEILSAIQKLQNSMDALPNDDLNNQVQQSFLKVFDLIEGLKGPTPPVNEAEFSSTKDVMINEASEETPSPPPKILETLTPWVNAARQLRADELVPKQTTSPPSSSEYQWDIPISPNAQYYPIFQPLHPHLSREMQTPIELHRLHQFFTSHAQPQKDVWSLRHITKVLAYGKSLFQKNKYFSFHVIRSDNKQYSFSEADFHNLNPNDLYVIGRHFLNRIPTHDSRLPFLQIQKFLRALLCDIGIIDGSLNNPTEQMSRDLEEKIGHKHRGPVEEPDVGVVFSKEKDGPRLKQKHLFTTEFVEEMIEVTLRSRKACKDLKIRIVMELEWLVAVRKWVKRVTELVNGFSFPPGASVSVEIYLRIPQIEIDIVFCTALTSYISSLDNNELQDYLCNKCKRPGHFARDCPNITVCNNCGLPGYAIIFHHIAAECTSTTMCWNCKKSGHLSNACPNDPVCHMCGKVGHLARDCHNATVSSYDARLCNNCYKSGHTAADCTNEKACNNCRKTGHLARDCPNEPVCNICSISGHVARRCPKLGGSGSGGSVIQSNTSTRILNFMSRWQRRNPIRSMSRKKPQSVQLPNTKQHTSQIKSDKQQLRCIQIHFAVFIRLKNLPNSLKST
ncbi:hypothetical protein LXL04_021954 [Taraxacum kok-saghyz]